MENGRAGRKFCRLLWAVGGRPPYVTRAYTGQRAWRLVPVPARLRVGPCRGGCSAASATATAAVADGLQGAKEGATSGARAHRGRSLRQRLRAVPSGGRAAVPQ